MNRTSGRTRRSMCVNIIPSIAPNGWFATTTNGPLAGMPPGRNLLFDTKCPDHRERDPRNSSGRPSAIRSYTALMASSVKALQNR